MFENIKLDLKNQKEISTPIQRISRKKHINWLSNLAFSGLEKILHINKNIKITESEFQSPIRSRFSNNDTGKIRHYHSAQDTNRAVVVLPQRGGGYNFAQLIARYLASQGIESYELITPLRESRFPRGCGSLAELDLRISDLERTFNQAITETRGLICNIDKEKIGICGISLGAIYSSIAYGIDDRLNSAALILAGGDLAGLIMNSEDKIAKAIRPNLYGLKEKELRIVLKGIEPCNHVNEEKTDNLLMITAQFDKDVPENYGNILKEAWGNPRTYSIKAGHVSVAKDIFRILPMILEHYDRTL